MTWSEVVPNLLIGLREGLEAGLVVTILLAALRQTAVGGRRVSSAGIWLGVLGAVMVAGSFAAVLTFSTDALAARWQDAADGLLSVLAVGLVTVMIFWMRRTAAALSGELRGKVEWAVAFGAGALALTAFLAVGREGLETTLFLWTAARAAGDTLAPIAGAAIGLAAAVALCWLLFRRAIRLNLAAFFSRTAIALIVIAAGVLSYGLGDLQEAGLLPGRAWVAFDLSSRIDASSWWAAILTGVTDLSARMTVLQVAAWIAYLAVAIPAFVAAGRRPAGAPAARGAPPAPARPAAGAGRGSWQERGAALVTRRPWAAAAGLVIVPAAAAGAAILALPADAADAATVTVTATRCAPGWSSARAGHQTFQVQNKSALAGEINLVNAGGAIVAEIETIGPATTAPLTANLPAGSYTFKCYLAGRPVTSSATVVAGRPHGPAPVPVAPVSVADLQPAAAAYRSYVAPQLRTLAVEVSRLRADLRLGARNQGDLRAARRDWLPAQLTWDRSGAAYPQTYADLQGTRVVLAELAPLIRPRSADLLPTARTQLATLQTALLGTRANGRWRSLADTPLAARQHVAAAVGAVLETLSQVPDLLEVPPHG